MALSVTHTAVVVVADDGTSPVGSDEWNATHTISGTLPAANLVAAGSDTQVMFNDSNAFAGDSGLLFDKTANTLTVLGNIELGDASANTLSASAGTLSIEGTALLKNGGALGTPSSGTLTNCTALPVAGITASTSTALGVGSIELGHASDTTIARSASGKITVESNAVHTSGYGNAEAVVALSDGATPALDASLGNVFTLAAAGDRTIAVPSNATTGQKIIIRHLASGGARTLALNSGAGGFRFGTDITALTQTTSGKYDYIGCIYNAVDSKWDVVAYAKGF